MDEIDDDLQWIIYFHTCRCEVVAQDLHTSTGLTDETRATSRCMHITRVLSGNMSHITQDREYNLP